MLQWYIYFIYSFFGKTCGVILSEAIFADFFSPHFLEKNTPLIKHASKDVFYHWDQWGCCNNR